ncbi:hypothetical protein KY284_000714 [Solanum tuberosum]|nr:hypothetical protein KY284_000711 [Solanum tuberosum]KAH0724849.1 hypothetical protein KY284_000714 [Solanum tuberosum]
MEHLGLSLGYRFYLAASEGLTFLLRFVAKKEIKDNELITTNLDVYGEEEPGEIYSHGVSSGGVGDDNSHNYGYFITKKNKGETRAFGNNPALLGYYF